MPMSSLSPTVRAFLERTIDTLDSLEVLLLLARTPDRAWTAEEVGTELRTSTFAATQRLQWLAAKGLVRRRDDGRSQFDGTDTMQAEQLAELAAAYRDRRTSVIAAIYTRPRPNDALMSFANAFKLKKPPEEP